MSTRLEPPSARWQASYLSLVAEFRSRGEPFIPFPLGFPTDDFDAFLASLRDAEQGNGPAIGFVPSSTYWLVENDTTVVAVSNLRHHLNALMLNEGGHIGYGVRPSARRRGHATAILAATLLAARERGLNRCLLVCDRDNLGSAQAIIRNGGMLEDERVSETHGTVVQRYWIDLVS